jgi:predicted transcriptional regulator
MSKATEGAERAVNGLLSVAQLLEEPRFARLYTFVLREGEVTIDTITGELEVPRTTAYSDTSTLVERGVLTRDESHKTHTYSAVPIALTATLNGNECTITPTLIAAVGQSPHDQDLDLLIETYGLGKLAVALTYAIPYVTGEMSERVATRELELQYAFGVAVLQALRDVVKEMESIDPFFEDIQNAHEDPPYKEY